MTVSTFVDESFFCTKSNTSRRRCGITFPPCRRRRSPARRKAIALVLRFSRDRSPTAESLEQHNQDAFGESVFAFFEHSGVTVPPGEKLGPLRNTETCSPGSQSGGNAESDCRTDNCFRRALDGVGGEAIATRSRRARRRLTNVSGPPAIPAKRRIPDCGHYSGIARLTQLPPARICPARSVFRPSCQLDLDHMVRYPISSLSGENSVHCRYL